jgi:hypothetical protein
MCIPGKCIFNPNPHGWWMKKASFKKTEITP